MKDEFDFTDAKRGAVAPAKGKTRITIMLDDAVIEAARTVAESEGYGYQTVINNTLRHALLDTGDLAEQADQGTHLGQFKKGITATDLKSLEKKLSAAINEIRRVLEPDVKP
ncbi:BrnA antitoxin family protein [Pseudomonas sp. B2M1-30]|uniref:BrnA antitoxin family protein n=1 Tax=Pseudomonas koreensis TaxID=198620 RepID=A0A9X2XKI2_9PSED|nr:MULTISPECIES: BrnA antitoxin family protein [Pseudomonas]MCU0121382.1 BrnA antitoxin family protein [Pseudomonas sp. B2M1-30]MCU7250391.1 BrnA antitoxin family protein [Pseudomonas koreensis]MCU7263622.1 BrnA antitoxin family protein [Pseudomonas koreensis]